MEDQSLRPLPVDPRDVASRVAALLLGDAADEAAAGRCVFEGAAVAAATAERDALPGERVKDVRGSESNCEQDSRQM